MNGNGWKKRCKRYAAPVWALFLAVSLILGGCGSGDSPIQSAGGEILESIAASIEEDVLDAAAEEIGGDLAGGPADDIWDDETQVSTGGGDADEEENAGQENGITVEFGEEYSDRDHVALYIHLYGELPPNYITKNEARDQGWDSGRGNLWEIAPGKSIGGDYFGNREGLLPKKKGRSYYECDINYEGGYRGGERIVFSDDGLVYYSADHYENFELLYDGEGPVE